jgi:adenosylhomocysteinase
LDIILDTDGSLVAEFDRPLVGGTLCSPRVAAEVANVTTRVVHIAAARFIENSVLSHGIGQACVSGLLDITNLQIAGAEVLVLGYEAIGEGVARYANAYGARVIVCEDDPIRAVKARMDGHLVMAIDEALPKTRVVFNTRQEGDGLNLGQIESLPNGAFLCSAISDEGVSPFAGLQSLAPGREIRDFVTQHDLPSGRDVKLVCGGMALHNKAARGLPLEFADILMAAQLWSIAQFINPECSLPPGLQPLSSHIEEALAEAFLDIG